MANWTNGKVEQADMWGGTVAVACKGRVQQLSLFTGQGPGGTVALPDGRPVAAQAGWAQGTLPLAQETQQQVPADSWPDPDELADCEGCKLD